MKLPLTRKYAKHPLLRKKHCFRINALLIPLSTRFYPKQYKVRSAGGTNIRHARYSLLITKTYAGVQLEFGRPSKEENKRLFDELFKYKTQIETAFGKPLNWERSDDTISSRIGCYVEGVNIFNNEDWDIITNFLVANIINFEAALRQHLINVKQTLSVTEESENE